MPDWANLSVGVAAVVAVVYVARVMRGVMSDVLAFFGNHMSSVTKTQADTARALQRLADEVRSMREEVRK